MSPNLSTDYCFNCEVWKFHNQTGLFALASGVLEQAVKVSPIQ